MSVVWPSVARSGSDHTAVSRPLTATMAVAFPAVRHGFRSSHRTPAAYSANTVTTRWLVTVPASRSAGNHVLPRPSSAAERTEKEECEAERDRERVLTSQGAEDRATHDPVVEHLRRVAVSLEEEEGGGADGEESGAGAGCPDPTAEPVRAGGHQHGTECGDELERDVVRDRDV